MTASGPRYSQRIRRLLGRAKHSADSSGTKTHFSFPVLSRSTFRTPSSASQGENDFGTQMRVPRPLLMVFALLIGLGSITFLTQALGKNSDRCLEIQSECRVLLEVVRTDVDRQKGLSGRSSLAADQGMLFVFDQASKRCIWMKDMLIDIDIVWLDATYKVVRLEKNVSPSTYPESFCAENTRYVIELASGGIDRLNIQTGKQLSL